MTMDISFLMFAISIYWLTSGEEQTHEMWVKVVAEMKNMKVVEKKKITKEKKIIIDGGKLLFVETVGK